MESLLCDSSMLYWGRGDFPLYSPGQDSVWSADGIVHCHRILYPIPLLFSVVLWTAPLTGPGGGSGAHGFRSILFASFALVMALRFFSTPYCAVCPGMIVELEYHWLTSLSYGWKKERELQAYKSRLYDTPASFLPIWYRLSLLWYFLLRLHP